MVRIYIDSKDICLLDSDRKIDAIKELTKKASVFSSIKNLPAFQKEVIGREMKMSTGIGKGIAIAHGDYPESDGIKIALGISEKGIEFDSIDQRPVHLMFLIASPKDSWTDYLNILASIVRMLHDERIRNSLQNQYNPAFIHSFLKNNLSYERP